MIRPFDCTPVGSIIAHPLSGVILCHRIINSFYSHLMKPLDVIFAFLAPSFPVASLLVSQNPLLLLKWLSTPVSQGDRPTPSSSSRCLPVVEAASHFPRLLLLGDEQSPSPQDILHGLHNTVKAQPGSLLLREPGYAQSVLAPVLQHGEELHSQRDRLDAQS